MKPSRYIALALTTLLLSCTKGEEGVSLETPIRFEPNIVSTPTARGLPLTALSASSMGVSAYFTETRPWAEVATTATPNWLNNEAVRRSGSSAPWATQELIYWPAYDAVTLPSKLSLFAYMPYATVDNGITLPAAAGAPRIGLELLEDVSSQTDLLLATSQRDQNRESDGGKIRFTLAHALSKIGFRAYCLTPGSTILSISLTNLPLRGEIAMDYPASWTLAPDVREYKLNLNGMPLSANPQKPTHLSDPNNYFLMFPADYRTGTHPELVVVYREKNEEKTKRTAITERWEMGKSILYSLNLGGKTNEDMTIESVSIDAWEVSGKEDLETN